MTVLRFSLLCLSAESPARLAEMVQSARVGVQPRWSPEDNCRLSFVYSNQTELEAKLDDAAKFLAEYAPESRKAEPLGFYYSSSRAAAGSVAFLYPGQGSQSIGMLAGLRSALPGFEDHLQRLDRMWQKASGKSLLELIYGDPDAAAEARLRDTRVAQPALGIVSTALRLSLEALGVKAQYHAGHSYGELPALCGADFLDEQLLLALSSERGKLLGEAGDLNPGTMLALNGERDAIEALCRRVSESLELANINSPQQLVISGPDDAIAALEKSAVAAGMPARKLKTSCAFHSSLMAPTARRWREVLQQHLQGPRPQPSARAFSNVTAKPYRNTGELINLLADQIVKPVRWADICSECVRLRADVFVEVGPGRILSDLLARNLPSGASPLILAADPRQEDAEQYVAHLFARLASRGVNVKWQFLAKPLEAKATAPAASSAVNSFLDSGRTVLDQYFAQQTRLIELALQHCNPGERQTLVQGALSANENIMKELLGSQQAVMLPLLSEKGAELPTSGKNVAPVSVPTLVSPPANEPQDLPARLAAVLKAEISRVTGFPAQAITPEAKFNDLGIDSLSMVDIWTQVLEQIPELACLADSVLEIHSLSDAWRTLSTRYVPAVSASCTARQMAVESFATDRWSEVRETVIHAMAAAGGINATELPAGADFENDLGIDVFQRERILDEVLSSHPSLRLPGRELLNARTLTELDQLLERFEPSAATKESVERFVLRDEVICAEFNGASDPAAEMPDRVLLVGSASSPTFARARQLLQGADKQVCTMSVAAEGWNVNGRIVPLESAQELRRALDKVFRQRAHAVIFLAETRRNTGDALDQTVESLFVLAQALWNRDTGSSSASLLTILGSETNDPLAEGSRGLARSLRREMPEVKIRTIWAKCSISDLDDALLLRALFSPELPDDLDTTDSKLISRVLEEQTTHLPSVRERVPGLTSTSRVLVLGGGDGISAEIGVALATAYGCEIVAIGRTPAPASMPFPEIPFGPDSNAVLKQKLFEARGNRASLPAEALHREWKLITRQRAIWSTRLRVEEAGGRFSYHSADVSNEESLRGALDSVRAGGIIDGVIHGAGIIRDNLLGRKTLSEFNEVVRTKSVPAKVLYECLASEPLKFVFFLSSMTSFTGTAGQTDYAAANQILNAIAHDWNQKVQYPVKSLLWSVWSDVGLAGPSLKTHMTRLGLSGISNEVGITLLLNELRYGQKEEDWVLFAPLSTLRYSLETQARSTTRDDSIAAISRGPVTFKPRKSAVCQA